MAQPVRILLAEDEALIAMALRRELEDAGYDVCGVTATGDEAIRLARAERPDVLLVDIRLAGEMDGIEAAERIREFSGAPVIFMTGYQDGEFIKRADTLDPIGYFVKPVFVDDIRYAIDSIGSSDHPPVDSGRGKD